MYLGHAVRNSLVIKVITVLTLMSINDPITQDRFADRGIIRWILGSCFYAFSGENKLLVNVGIYGLVVSCILCNILYCIFMLTGESGIG